MIRIFQACLSSNPPNKVEDVASGDRPIDRGRKQRSRRLEQIRTRPLEAILEMRIQREHRRDRHAANPNLLPLADDPSRSKPALKPSDPTV
jgi:hypothetical protein